MTWLNKPANDDSTGAPAEDDVRLLNLNFINSETFFNFSCYETGQ